jgi:hypothetical protein
MNEDILVKLKREFEQQLVVLAAAKTAVAELRLAIAAVEDSRRCQITNALQPPCGGKALKRGTLKSALLDCLNSGIGARSAFEEALKERGIETSANSISNALYRMMLQKEIGWDPRRKAYFIRNEEGSDRELTEPLQTDGAAVGAA